MTSLKTLNRAHNPTEMLTAYCEVARMTLNLDQLRYWCLRHCVDQYGAWSAYDQVIYVTDEGDTWRISTETQAVRPYLSEYKQFSWYWLLRYEDAHDIELRGYQSWLKWVKMMGDRVRKHIELIDTP